jgi:hypothetical protein
MAIIGESFYRKQSIIIFAAIMCIFLAGLGKVRRLVS